jgi:outer membrane protein OmpA-like peptidoglycan-associated protein
MSPFTRIRRLACVLPLAVAAVAATGPAAAQPAGDADRAGGRALDLVFPVLDLRFVATDLGNQAASLQVRETSTEIRVALAADVLFDFDKATLRPEAREALRQLAAVIVQRSPRGAARIEGHTDALGSDAYNQRLSEQRARAVRDWLASADGLRGVRFSGRGFGESRPVAANTKPDGSDDPEGRQRNRRVEVVIARR